MDHHSSVQIQKTRTKEKKDSSLNNRIKLYYTVTEYLHTQFKPIKLQSDAIFPLLVPEIGFIFVLIVRWNENCKD